MAFKPPLSPLFPPQGLSEPALAKGVQITAVGMGFPCQALGQGLRVWVSSLGRGFGRPFSPFFTCVTHAQEWFVVSIDSKNVFLLPVPYVLYVK